MAEGEEVAPPTTTIARHREPPALPPLQVTASSPPFVSLPALPACLHAKHEYFTFCCKMQRGLVTVLIWAWAGTSAQPTIDGSDPTQFFLLFPRVFLRLFLLVSEYIFMSLKIQNPIFKYTVFVNLKKIEKNVFVHTAKCLKAKKSFCVFHTSKNNV